MGTATCAGAGTATGAGAGAGAGAAVYGNLFEDRDGKDRDGKEERMPATVVSLTKMDGATTVVITRRRRGRG
jgi:hypothetical protein